MSLPMPLPTTTEVTSAQPAIGELTDRELLEEIAHNMRVVSAVAAQLAPLASNPALLMQTLMGAFMGRKAG